MGQSKSPYTPPPELDAALTYLTQPLFARWILQQAKKKRLGKESMKVLFRHPSVKTIVEYIKKSEDNCYWVAAWAVALTKKQQKDAVLNYEAIIACYVILWEHAPSRLVQLVDEDLKPHARVWWQKWMEPETKKQK
jgi:hypothetical protein